MERGHCNVGRSNYSNPQSCESFLTKKKNTSDLNKCRLDGDGGATAKQRSYIKLILEK